MKFILNFKEEDNSFRLKFSEMQIVSDGGYEKGYEDGRKSMTDIINKYDTEIALQGELIDQALAELNGKVDPELYNKGYNEGYDKGYIDGAEANKDYVPDLVNDTLVEYSSDKITKVKKYGFAEMFAMKSISLPNCTYLDTSAFQLNSATEMYLPKVEYVGQSAFAWCKFSSIEMPVTTISERGFYYCGNLKTLIISQSETVCTLGGTLSLKGTPFEKGTGFIYVPDNLVEDYKVATNWSDYASQIKPLSELGE